MSIKKSLSVLLSALIITEPALGSQLGGKGKSQTVRGQRQEPQHPVRAPGLPRLQAGPTGQQVHIFSAHHWTQQEHSQGLISVKYWPGGGATVRLKNLHSRLKAIEMSGGSEEVCCSSCHLLLHQPYVQCQDCSSNGSDFEESKVSTTRLPFRPQ